MTPKDAYEVVLNAAVAGSFDAVVEAWDAPWDFDYRDNWPGLREELDATPSTFARFAIWDRYLTDAARRIAEELLGEPFDFPSFEKGWRSVSSDREDPIWDSIMARRDQ